MHPEISSMSENDPGLLVHSPPWMGLSPIFLVIKIQKLAKNSVHFELYRGGLWEESQ